MTDKELVDYLVKTAIKGGFRVEAPPGFDVLEAREGREFHRPSSAQPPAAPGAVCCVGDHL